MQARDSSSDDSLESLQDGSLFMQDERMEEDAKHRIRADEEWQSSADEEQFPRSIEFLFYMISFLSSSNYCIMLVLGYLANGEITLSFLLQFSLFVLCESIGSAICSQLYERMHIKKIAILSAVSGMFASAVLTISSFSLLQMAQPSLVISARAVQGISVGSFTALMNLELNENADPSAKSRIILKNSIFSSLGFIVGSVFLIFILKENFINERSLESSVNNVFDSGFFMLSLYSLLNFVIVLLCISCLLPNRTRIGSFEEFDTEWDEHLDSINFSEDDRRSVFPFKLSTFFDTESISLSRSNAIFSFFYYFSFFGVLIMYQTAISVYFSFTFVEIMMLTHIQNISEHFLSSWIYLSGFAFIPLICLTIAKPLNRIIGSYFVVLVGSILVFSGWFCMLFLDFKEAKVLGGSLILSGFSISRSALTPLFVRLFEPGPQKYRLFSLEIFIFASRVVTPILLWACGETYISKLGLILSSITLGGLTSGFFCLRPHPSITHHPSSLMCKPSSASEEDSLLDDELDFTHTPTKISPVSLPGVILQHPISYRFK